ncbi:molybdate ABC transporter substrate-binding protein [Billgrantia antri]|uniref:molybdate ABC transporter substrate-binding protein n=1 Tax=Billgrantia antri TaxID=2846777 RepID=UPI003B220D95
MQSIFKRLLMSVAALGMSLALTMAQAEQEPTRIAAAASLRAAMDELVATYRTQHPTASLEAVYGASGSLRAQIENGAPFDLFFSADMAFPQALAAGGHAAGGVTPYAEGRLVLWSEDIDASTLTLGDLADARFRRIAIANPRHAPYGARAEEALRASGLWQTLEPKLVFGENIGQALQMVHSGAANVGILALAQMHASAMRGSTFHLIDSSLHQPLENGFIVTRRGGDDPTARGFADFMQSPEALRILEAYGFSMPRGD